MMLREMQVVVSKERASKEELQSKLDSLSETLAAKEAQFSNDSKPKPNENAEKVTAVSCKYVFLS